MTFKTLLNSLTRHPLAGKHWRAYHAEVDAFNAAMAPLKAQVWDESWTLQGYKPPLELEVSSESLKNKKTRQVAEKLRQIYEAINEEIKIHNDLRDREIKLKSQRFN